MSFPHKRFNPNQNKNNRSEPRKHFPPKRPQQDESQLKFLSQTAVDPSPRIQLEKGSTQTTARALDLICPIGMGQRGLIVAPPGSGKTTFLKHICEAISTAYPEVKLYCLLIDERPEEVTDFCRNVPGEVRHSSSDETYDHHIKTAQSLMKQVVQEAGDGQNVMVLIDSLTRLSRVHNAESRSSGRTLSGGVDARALEIPRRIFGLARKLENGGSLGILATILVDTGSRMDQVIFEEFKGTGNMEVYLSREIASQRVYPSIDILKSGTRREELLLGAEEYEKVSKMRRALCSLSPLAAAQALAEKLAQTKTNAEILAEIPS